MVLSAITWKGIYIFSLWLGVRARNPMLLIYPLDYVRAWEYPIILKHLKALLGTSVLDIGSGSSVFPVLMAYKGHNVWLMDTNREALFTQKKYCKHCGLENIHIILGDARWLPFRDESFQRITAISSIEHIRGNGDSISCKEMGRVLSINGIAALTVPVSSSYQELETASYTQSFHKRYDALTLAQRLIKPSKLAANVIFMKERGKFGSTFYKLPIFLKVFCGHAVALASSLFLYSSKTDSHAANAIVLFYKNPMENQL